MCEHSQIRWEFQISTVGLDIAWICHIKFSSDTIGWNGNGSYFSEHWFSVLFQQFFHYMLEKHCVFLEFSWFHVKERHKLIWNQYNSNWNFQFICMKNAFLSHFFAFFRHISRLSSEQRRNCCDILKFVSRTLKSAEIPLEFICDINSFDNYLGLRTRLKHI